MAVNPNTSADRRDGRSRRLASRSSPGAFLLFQVQPLVSKAILPWFGGCPAVWTTCMLFFQVVLFAGYCYAHLLQRWLPPRRQAAVHLALVVGGAGVAADSAGTYWKPHDGSNPTWQILLLLDRHGGASVFRPFGDQPAGSGVVQRRLAAIARRIGSMRCRTRARWRRC